MRKFKFVDSFKIEDIKRAPFNESRIIVPDYALRRFEHGNSRFYYRAYPGGKLSEPAISSTSITNFMKEGVGLSRWKMQVGGTSKANQIANEKSFVGDFVHMMIQQYLVGLIALTPEFYQLTFEDIRANFEAFAKLKGRPQYLVDDYIEQVDKTMFAFEMFCRDHNVVPILIEHALIDEGRNRGSQLDLYCELDVKEKGDWGEVYKSGPRKGEPKITYQKNRRFAIIDWKSGMKGFYPNHELQLHINKSIFHANFDAAEHPVEYLFNWSPVDFNPRAKSGDFYRLKDQTDSKCQYLVEQYTDIAHVEVGDIYSKPFKTLLVGLWGPGRKDPDDEPFARCQTVYERLIEHERGKADHVFAMQYGNQAEVDDDPFDDDISTDEPQLAEI